MTYGAITPKPEYNPQPVSTIEHFKLMPDTSNTPKSKKEYQAVKSRFDDIVAESTKSHQQAVATILDTSRDSRSHIPNNSFNIAPEPTYIHVGNLDEGRIGGTPNYLLEENATFQGHQREIASFVNTLNHPEYQANYSIEDFTSSSTPSEPQEQIIFFSEAPEILYQASYAPLDTESRYNGTIVANMTEVNLDDWDAQVRANGWA